MLTCSTMWISTRFLNESLWKDKIYRCFYRALKYYFKTCFTVNFLLRFGEFSQNCTQNERWNMNKSWEMNTVEIVNDGLNFNFDFMTQFLVIYSKKCFQADMQEIYNNWRFFSSSISICSVSKPLLKVPANKCVLTCK